MDLHALEYFSQFSDDTSQGHFHRVIVLDQDSGVSWDYISELVPSLSRGWYELSHLEVKDRIEFIRDFWISKMPFHPRFSNFANNFFASLDDVGIFVTQKLFDSPFEACLVYSLRDDNGFFHGGVGSSPSDIELLQKEFPDRIFPEDYLSFLEIHNGFSKSTDTGIIPTKNLHSVYENFQQFLRRQDPLFSNGRAVDPQSLIPFYESFGLNCYHCFWSDWYPAQEMGNVYYSSQTNSISQCSSNESSPENLTFPTFTDWLMFYLEKVS